MLNFIIGREGTGKTVYTHKLLGDYIKDNETTAILLVPKQFTFDSDKGILDALGPKDACNVEVLSFTRLADVIFKSCRGINKPLLKDGANAAIMALALESIKDQLQLFQRHCNSISFVRKMIDQIGDFKQNTISADELFAVQETLEGGLLKQKLYETALIFKTYDALVAQSFFDDKDVLSLVYEILLEYDFFKGKVIAIDGFNDFTAQELRIIERMIVSAKDVFVTLCTDNVNSTDELSPFDCVNKTARKLRSIATKNGVETAVSVKLDYGTNDFVTYNEKAIAHLESNLYNPLYEAFDGDASEVTICVAPSIKEECDFVALQIKKLMREKGYRCRDIAVVYRSDESYQKQIKYSLKKFGISVFEDRRAPIENEPLSILVRSLLQMRVDGFSTENLMRYLKTGLTDISHDDISSLENYALLWDIGAKEWQSEWTGNPDGFGIEMNEKRTEYLAALNNLREAIISPLEDLKDKMKNADGLSCMRMIFNFLIEKNVNENLKNFAISLEEKGNIELAIEQEQIWDIIMNVLDDIAMSVNTNIISEKMMLEIFDLVVSSRSLGKLPDGYDEVFICDASRISTKMFKAVFAVGMNSGVFPLEPTESGIFTRNEKNTLRPSIDKLRDDSRYLTSEERFFVYNTLCSAREKLFITYSLLSASGDKLSESSVVGDVRKILPSCNEIEYLSIKTYDLIESELPTFELMAKSWNDDSSESAALKKYFSSLPGYKGKTDSIRRATMKKNFEFENSDYAKKLFGKSITLSSTQLETYGNCPFKYFCRYGMNAKPREIAKLDPAKSGTIIHYVLEVLLNKYKGKAFLELSKEQIEDEINLLLDEYMEKFMGGKQNKNKRFIYLYERMRKILCTIFDRLIAEFSKSNFEPCDFELRIGKDGEIQPSRVELDDGYIELCGSVDRVDKMDVNGKRYIRVVDYKTGEKVFSLSDVLSGINMQMLIYLVSIWKGGKEKYGDIIPAGVLYYPANVKPFDAERDEDEFSIRKKILSNGQMNGMILDDETVIKGMDENLEGIFIKIKLNKSNQIQGNFINLAQLGVLAKKMEGIMAEMGNSLHKGKIPARPIVGNSHGNICDFCDYSSVCQRESDGEFRFIKKESHEECLAELDGGEDNGTKLDN